MYNADMKRLGIVLAILSAVTILSCGTVLVTSAKSADPPRAYLSQPITADGVLSIVNAKRVQNGLKPLVRDARLDQTAQERADDMIKRDYRSHFDPIDGHKMINNQDFGCKGGSENISWDWYSNASVVNGWWGSKSHHDAILRADYTLTGVAVNGNVVVQHFCTTK